MFNDIAQALHIELNPIPVGTTFVCAKCQKYFKKVNQLGCTVIHLPWQCCHYQDKEITKEEFVEATMAKSLQDTVDKNLFNNIYSLILNDGGCKWESPIKGPSTLEACRRENDTTYIRFKNGGTYQYEGIPIEVYEQLKTAESPGSFFAQNIKGKYKATKVK